MDQVRRETPGARVVVPVARPASLDSLLPVAVAMAGVEDGTVVPVTVVPPGAPADVVEPAAQLAVEAERRLRRAGVEATGVVAEARSVASGVRSVVTSEDATLVVMGWRGIADTSQAFDATVDDVLGRSSVPLLVVRPADVPTTRVVLPLTAAHVGPVGRAGLDLATTLVRRITADAGLDVSVLWAGDDDPNVPDAIRELSDRLHNDPRRLDEAVGAMARAGDLVVAAVAATASGLREVTTHVTAATPSAGLVVAIDPGPRRRSGLGAAVAEQVRIDLAATEEPVDHVVAVTVNPPVGTRLSRRQVVRSLTHLGTVSDVQVQWRAATGRQQLRVEVTLPAPTSTLALGEVMSAMHEAPSMTGSDLQYEVARAASPVQLDRLEPLGSIEP